MKDSAQEIERARARARASESERERERERERATLAFCMTVPLVEAYTDGGLLRISVAQLTGKASL